LAAAQEKTATTAARKEGRMTSVDLKHAQQTPAPGRPVSSLTQKIFLSLVLAVAVVGVYSPVHWQPFANYDDPDYVTDNFHVKAGLHWETVKWALTARDAANWHPVTWISHALDTSLFGLNPAGPHDVNVLLHIVNALLLFWVLQRATGFIGRSWMVAALFALHPINVETVAWIAERKNLLSMFFLLLTLAAYRWYAGNPQLSRYLVVAALFALGLMSKPQVITLPFVLLLWDYWPLGRVALRSSPSALRQNTSGEISGEKRTANSEWQWLLWEKLPLLALCAMSAVFTLNAQASGGATSYYGHVLRLENALISYVRYLGKAFWPSRLALFYPYPLNPYPLWQVCGAAFILLAITVAVLLAHRHRALTVGWLWFLGTLVPMIGVVQVGTQAMADRYAYLSFVGLFIMVCWLIAALPGFSQNTAGTERLHLPPALLPAVSVVVLLALALVSFHQVSFWSDHITLWTHVLEVTNDNWVAENNLGTALLKTGRVEEAIPHFRAAMALDPTDPNSTLNIGTYEQMHRNLPAAIELYQRAAGMARNPKIRARAYNNLAYAYKESGDFADARASFQRAVTIDPEFVGAWISLGLVAQNTGDLPLAIRSYSRAMQISPSDFGYLLLAGALEASGEKTQAASARQKALLLSSNIAAAQRHADKLLAQ
jgi:tetratricopeptide (TPR) repeat protein